MRDKIVGVNAHVVVLKSTATFAEYRDVLALAERTPGVVAAQPFVFREVDMAGARKAPSTVAVKAVDPARVGRVLTVGRHMTTGTIDSLGKNENAIILGDDLASQLGVGLGDDVKLTLTRMDGPSVTQSFRVTGLFHVAFDEYDERLAFVSLRAMQALVGRGDQVMGIEMIVKDLDRSAAIVNTLVQALGGPPYQVMDWYELNKQLFTALYGERRP